ncbi:MAG: toll/interleukin-1 receptor domain-containing protein [Chloroflexi bacterium]|nr:toll/interleukin-1 receptor domain-containing protein [Chloroflexota bacterium]
MANPEHVAVVRQGAAAIARWHEQHPREGLDLREADLREASLWRADLAGADLTGATLTLANFRGANLSEVTFIGTDLRWSYVKWSGFTRGAPAQADLGEATLRRVLLTGADLSGANLSEANLRGAHFTATDLRGANLRGACLSRALFAATTLGDVDLSDVVGLATVSHLAPSTIGVDTLIASFRGAGNRLTPELTTFFRAAGVPEELLDALPRILAEVKYYICFISYGQPDVAFARKLSEDLKARGVTCWLYELDKTPGERTWREIVEKRRSHEKMLVLCSLKALFRDAVKKEIEEQIDEDPDKIIPISLDDEWRRHDFEVRRGQGPDLRPRLLELNYLDFADPSRYDEQLAVLLEKALRRRDTPIA